MYNIFKLLFMLTIVYFMFLFVGPQPPTKKRHCRRNVPILPNGVFSFTHRRSSMVLGFRCLAPADDLHKADHGCHSTHPDPEQRFYIHQVQHGPSLLSLVVHRSSFRREPAPGGFLSFGVRRETLPVRPVLSPHKRVP